MSIVVPQDGQKRFRLASSIAADVWRPKPHNKAYEWWYFDALSDDGRDALVIIFFDNFVFSPRYNRGTTVAGQNGEAAAHGGKESAADNSEPASSMQSCRPVIPAVEFFYCRDGKPLYHAINEFDSKDFLVCRNTPSFQIGDNFFRFESAPYGSGYFLSIKSELRKKCRLEASFEWLSIESDFLTDEEEKNHNEYHVWNVAVSRADVSGRIRVTDENDEEVDVIHFRGTGYHDHNFDSRWLPETVEDWQWGRAHFSDATAVFYRYKEYGQSDALTKLLIIRDGRLEECDARCEVQQFARDFYGIRYPQLLLFTTGDDLCLRVEQTRVLDSNLLYLRFLSEMSLMLPDGKTRRSTGIAEYLNPKILKYRWLDWLVNMRISRPDKGSPSS